MGAGWLVGAVINVGGNVAANLGQNIMKLGFNKREALEQPEEEKPSIVKFRAWQIGMVIFIAGNVANFASLGFAAQSLLAALGSVQFVANVIFAATVLKEKVTWLILVATAAIIGGCLLLVVFGDHSSATYSVVELKELYSKPAYVVYLVMSFVFVFGFYVLYLHGKHVLKQPGQQSSGWGQVQPVAYSLFSALIGTQSVLFSKSLSVLLRMTFQGQNQLGNWYTWVTLLCFIIAAAFWGMRLNKGLRMFPVMMIVPLLQISWVLLSTISGLLYFQEYRSFTALKAGMYALGIVIVLVGVYLITLNCKRQLKQMELDGMCEGDAEEDQKIEVTNNPIYEAGPLHDTLASKRCNSNTLIGAPMLLTNVGLASTLVKPTRRTTNLNNTMTSNNTLTPALEMGSTMTTDHSHDENNSMISTLKKGIKTLHQHVKSDWNIYDQDVVKQASHGMFTTNVFSIPNSSIQKKKRPSEQSGEPRSVPQDSEDIMSSLPASRFHHAGDGKAAHLKHSKLELIIEKSSLHSHNPSWASDIPALKGLQELGEVQPAEAAKALELLPGSSPRPSSRQADLTGKEPGAKDQDGAYKPGSKQGHSPQAEDAPVPRAGTRASRRSSNRQLEVKLIDSGRSSRELQESPVSREDSQQSEPEALTRQEPAADRRATVEGTFAASQQPSLKQHGSGRKTNDWILLPPRQLHRLPPPRSADRRDDWIPLPHLRPVSHATRGTLQAPASAGLQPAFVGQVRPGGAVDGAAYAHVSGAQQQQRGYEAGASEVQRQQHGSRGQEQSSSAARPASKGNFQESSSVTPFWHPFEAAAEAAEAAEAGSWGLAPGRSGEVLLSQGYWRSDEFADSVSQQQQQQHWPLSQSSRFSISSVVPRGAQSWQRRPASAGHEWPALTHTASPQFHGSVGGKPARNYAPSPSTAQAYLSLLNNGSPSRAPPLSPALTRDSVTGVGLLSVPSGVIPQPSVASPYQPVVAWPEAGAADGSWPQPPGSPSLGRRLSLVHPRTTGPMPDTSPSTAAVPSFSGGSGGKAGGKPLSISRAWQHPSGR